MVSRRKQPHRRMVVIMIIFLAVAGITTLRHAHRDTEVLP
jgi:hypothetical protein